MGVYIKGVTKQELKRIFGKARIQYNSTDLIEVKTPHGRLIDVAKIPYLECADPEVAELVGEAPTVIEAEEDELWI